MNSGIAPYYLDHNDLDITSLNGNTYKKAIRPIIDGSIQQVFVGLTDFSCFNNQYNNTRIDSIYICCENLKDNQFATEQYQKKLLKPVIIGTWDEELYRKNYRGKFPYRPSCVSNQRFHYDQNSLSLSLCSERNHDELEVSFFDKDGNPLNIQHLHPRFTITFYIQDKKY